MLPFVIYLLCLVVSDVAGLRCYVCSANQDKLDEHCINNPELLPNAIRNTNNKYCTSFRQEYRDPKDKVASITRGSNDKPEFMNEVHEDATYIHYSTACQTDLCNGGSGKASSGTSGLIDDSGTALVLLVPGIGSENRAGSVVATNLLFIVILAFAVLVFNM